MTIALPLSAISISIIPSNLYHASLGSVHTALKSKGNFCLIELHSISTITTLLDVLRSPKNWEVPETFSKTLNILGENLPDTKYECIGMYGQKNLLSNLSLISTFYIKEITSTKNDSQITGMILLKVNPISFGLIKLKLLTPPDICSNTALKHILTTLVLNPTNEDLDFPTTVNEISSNILNYSVISGNLSEVSLTRMCTREHLHQKELKSQNSN